ncbi:MAG: YkgJ family cysteine cluster protein [Desulfovibrio sp.]|jgi:Fe-S-cluster containining protein|nr:YkgJ family cysteine cluster protein [Desulfovibrio sp.]
MPDIRAGILQESEKPSFDCLRCGHCCQGRGGIVASEKDVRRLCGRLRMTVEAFAAAYGERRGGKLLIRAGEDGACIFFKKNEGCAVHTVKPDICRAWPYFRGNLLDRDSLELCKEFCPGIPPSLPHADFVLQGTALLQREGLIGTGGADEAGALQTADLFSC